MVGVHSMLMLSSGHESQLHRLAELRVPKHLSWAVHEVRSHNHSCGPMLPSSIIIRIDMLNTTRPLLRDQIPAVVPVSCTMHPAQQLHRRLHQAAAPGKAMQSQSRMTQA